MPSLSRSEFAEVVRRRSGGGRTLCIPVAVRLLADQVTPVLAYRRLVSADARTAPSFLLESVEGGERQGRFSIMGAQPRWRVTARGHRVEVDLGPDGPATTRDDADPLLLLRTLGAHLDLVRAGTQLPETVLGGWFGYAGYDTVRYAEPGKLGFERAPCDDRDLPDLEFAFYDGVVVFDHVRQIVHVVTLAMVRPDEAPHSSTLERIYSGAIARLDARVAQIQTHSRPLPLGRMDRAVPAAPMASNLTREQHRQMVAGALEYIRAGDIFQVVLGQRFETRAAADPFDVYRALRAVNPSPYMVYMQTSGCILVASSPEILCRVRGDHQGAFTVTNRPLAGTRRRGATPEEDAALERELLGDPKERAEHIMLVDLGRNDVGQVAEPGSIRLAAVMDIERYSHVMHISSTVTGTLRPGLDCWNALRAALPVGTISGAPKIRAMQIIDELELVRRGPYGGGMGYVAVLDGHMDIALAVRTIVVPVQARDDSGWLYHVQASGGIVADSDPDAEYEETVNKAAAAGAIEAAADLGT